MYTSEQKLANVLDHTATLHLKFLMFVYARYTVSCNGSTFNAFFVYIYYYYQHSNYFNYQNMKLKINVAIKKPIHEI